MRIWNTQQWHDPEPDRWWSSWLELKILDRFVNESLCDPDKQSWNKKKNEQAVLLLTSSQTSSRFLWNVNMVFAFFITPTQRRLAVSWRGAHHSAFILQLQREDFYSITPLQTKNNVRAAKSLKYPSALSKQQLLTGSRYSGFWSISIRVPRSVWFWCIFGRFLQVHQNRRSLRLRTSNPD